jgi:Mrp family chromosome partitioning ATPase
MTAPAVRQRPPHRPLDGSAWIAARLALALRRTRRFTRWWLGIGGTVTVIALLLPVAAGDPDAASRLELERAAADTLRTGATLRRLRTSAADAESLLVDARAVRATIPAAVRAPRDPRLTTLDAAIAMARATRGVPAFLTLAEDPAVRYGPRMQAIADSLRRATTDDERIRLGNTIIAIAEFRRNAIAGESVENDAPEPAPATLDTLATATRAAALRDSLAAATRAHESAKEAVVRIVATADAGRAPVPPLSPGLALLAALAAGLVLRVGSAALREFREPHLAHPLEAERAVGASALALVRDPLPEGPLRFRPSGVDPFRVLYLGLTATGTRTRALIVTGEDPVIVAAVGARLAIAAAADHRTTLVGEVDSEQIALSRVFRDHAEPGFSDALAGSFKWREVARAVGSSDGLAITMLPAGTTRDPLGEDALRAGIAAFQAFREGFEFTILAVSLRDLERARRFLPGAPTVLCATIAETPVAAFQAAGAAVQASGERLHSLVLWDAPRPTLPSRAELAAYLSKRKGRTPGGSFKAVQEATKKPV